MSVVNESPEAFDRLGYVLVRDVLTHEEVQACLNGYSSFRPHPNRYRPIAAIEPTLVLNDAFMAVLRNKRLITTVIEILGRDLQLLSYEAHETPPHFGAVRNWHVDLHVWTELTLTVTAAIYLVDLSLETGALYVIPESQRWGRPPASEEEGQPHPDEIAVLASAGDAVLFNGSIWHTAGRNETQTPRRAIFPYFGHYWMKRLDEYYEAPLPQRIVTGKSALTRQLFGLQLSDWSIHGSYYCETDYSR